jgi:hypothetical protein
METQSGARTPLVDPFGREVEEWLRDAPATRSPYLADLVVPPVTGPVRRPVLPAEPAAETADAPAAVRNAPEVGAVDVAADSAFRRPRDRARHASVCAPSFPEPPERLALRFDDLAVELSASTGRTTIERIVLLEDEVRRRDEDLARLAAWEATVAHLDDPEVEGARAFAREVFADLLADAAEEADRRARVAARRAATRPMPLGAVRERVSAPQPALHGRPVVVDVDPEPEVPTSAPQVAVRPVPTIAGAAPVSANTRPTPLVQPATGPTVIDRDAVAAVLRARLGGTTTRTSSVAVVLPPVPETTADDAVDAPADTIVTATDGQEAPVDSAEDRTAGWWSRLVARVLRLVGRR